MYYVKNQRDGKEIHNPEINLAIEYYLLNEKKLDEAIVFFYINEPSVIVGKNQNTYEEVNLDYIEKERVKVVRRFSGGGAVYHDLGVLNFCFITQDDGKSFRNFKRFTQPIIDVLHEMGVEGAGLKGRNDLVINDQKFSGNAMYTNKGRMTSHGTLMLDSQIDAVVSALRPKKHKLKSKGIKSVHNRVTNIKPYLDEQYQNINTKQFRDIILLQLFGVGDLSQVKEYILTEEDWEKIDAFAEKYTANWEWNYGESPDFDLERSQRLSIGTVDIKLNVKKGNISKIKIYGDFFGKGEISDVEEALTGIDYNQQAIRQTLQDLDIDFYFGDVELDELVALIY